MPVGERHRFPFLFGGTFIEARLPVREIDEFDDFPSFSEGLSLRHYKCKATKTLRKFPFLFGGTFIEAGD